MKHTTRLLLFTAILLIIGNLWVNRWPTTLYYGDSNGYYLHVVSFFVNQDVGDYDKTITTLREVNPGSSDPREDEFGIRLTEKGRRYIKYTLGVPVMETPFFLLAHAYASVSPTYEANGWSKPYMLSVGFAIICYLILGLWMLISILKRYFSDGVVTLVVLSLVLATNLFYQSNYVTMSHGFLFFQHCLLIWLTVKFYDKDNWWKALAVGATVGLITLTRVPEVVSVLAALLWGVTSFKSLGERIQFFGKNFHYLLLAGIGFLAVFSLQIAYWYYVSGHFIFNPYQGEGFDFTKPRFLKAFFDFKNGWLIYTPIMAFSVAGFFWLRRYAKGLLLPILGFVVPHMWVHYSYYVYSYFPGLGQRPMVETYPYLSFTLAASFAALLATKRWKWVPIAALIGLATLNTFQTWQSKEGIIWSERHNRAFYWASFGKTSSSMAALRAYDSNARQPNEAKIKLERELFFENFEDTTQLYRLAMDTTRAISGQHSFYSPQEFYTLIEALPLAELQSSNWLKFSIQAYMESGTVPGHRDQCASLIVEFMDETGKKRRTKHIAISTHLGNPNGNIWTPGYPDQWGEAAFYVQLPKGIERGWTAKAFLYNWSGQKLFLDDFRIAYYND